MKNQANKNLSLYGNYGINNCIKSLGDGVWAGEGVTAAGERLYFGVEKIRDRSDQDYWTYFSRFTERMTQKNFKKPEEVQNTRGRRRDNDEVENYQNFYNGRIQFRQNCNIKEEFLNQVSHAISAFPPDKSDGFNDYVIYASKTEITGRHSFSQTEEDLDNAYSFDPLYCTQKLDSFLQEHENIIMVMRSNLAQGDTGYENRGIARTLAGLLDPGYKGISLAMHSFSGLFYSNVHPDKKHLVIRPMQAMQGMIINAFGGKEGCKVKKYSGQLEDMLKETQATEQEQAMFIPTKLLVEYFESNIASPHYNGDLSEEKASTEATEKPSQSKNSIPQDRRPSGLSGFTATSNGEKVTLTPVTNTHKVSPKSPITSSKASNDNDIIGAETFKEILLSHVKDHKKWAPWIEERFNQVNPGKQPIKRQDVGTFLDCMGYQESGKQKMLQAIRDHHESKFNAPIKTGFSRS